MGRTDRVLVTGGAGFIGSHLAERLTKAGHEVIVLDNLRTGKLENLEGTNKSNLVFVRGDLLDRKIIRESLDGVSIVFHLAANPEVRVGAIDTSLDFQQNLLATYNLLDEMKKANSARKVVFASTSTVYGEAAIIPTPEDYGPLIPISLYGASKLGCEALISSYCHLFDFRSVLYRFANVVGPRTDHGVIHDFVNKLRKDSGRLEILGDGTQNKSYLLVTDCVDAFLAGLGQLESNSIVTILNVGSEDQLDTVTLAEIVAQEMRLQNVTKEFTGGYQGRGWRGDVKQMLLDINKIKRLGWKPRFRSAEAVRLAVRDAILDR